MEDISYQDMVVRFVNVAPMLHHNNRLSNPFDPICKMIAKLNKKPARTRTDDDRQLMALLEWAGGLYTTDPPVAVDERARILEGGKVCVPAHVLEGMICATAKRMRLKSKFLSGVMVEEDSILEHNGPKSLQALMDSPGYRDIRSVVIPSSKAHIMRCRPIFRSWSFVATIKHLPSVVNKEEVMDVLELGGRTVGIGDYIPRYGRFMVEEVNGHKG